MHPRTRSHRRPPQEDGTCHVATVVAQYSTLVKDDQLVFPEELGRRASVRPGGARAGGDDSFKGRAAGALQLHPAFDIGGYGQLGDAGPDVTNGGGPDLADESGGL